MLFVPATVPKVPLAEVWPLDAVTELLGVMLPPPLVTAQFTVTPLTGFPKLSWTSTTKGTASDVFTVPVWLSPDILTKVEATDVLIVSV